MITALVTVFVGVIVLCAGQMLSNHMATVFRQAVGDDIRERRAAIDSDGGGCVVVPVDSGQLGVRFSWALDVVQTVATIAAGVPVTLVVATTIWDAPEIIFAIVGLLPIVVFLWIRDFDANRYAALSQRKWPLIGQVSPGFRLCFGLYVILIVAVGLTLGMNSLHCQLEWTQDGAIGALLRCPAP